LTFGTLGDVTGLTSGEAEGKEGVPAADEAAKAAEPEEEKKRQGRLFRRGTGRFF